MSKDSEPQQNLAVEAWASLLDAEARGGPTAIRGFDFQRRYALILLLKSLPDPEWSAVMVEGAEDVEARFDRPSRIERRATQLKNYRVTVATAREIVEHFRKLDVQPEKDRPGTWAAFVIACTELDDTLKTIHNGLERYRPAGSFYTADDAILANTQADLKRQIEAAKLPLEFVLERVIFEPGLQPYNEEEWVRARALALLHEASPGISHATAEEIYLRLKDLVSESTAKSIERRQVMAVIDKVRAGRLEVSARTARPPFMQAPQPPAKYVERPAELKRMKEALLPVKRGAPPPVSRVILHGMVAVGKSVLAAAFAHEAVQDAFPDGVLWVTLGTNPDIPQRLADWGRALHDPSVFKSPYPDAQAGTSQLLTLLQDKECLLVVDDVWEKKHVEPFLVGGSRCLVLLTSRKADVLPDAAVLRLDEMREEEALKLMANWAEGIATEDQAIAAGLARELGYLPLALELTGAQVKEQGSWQAVRQLWEEEKLAAIERGWHPDSPQDSLPLSLELSWRALHEDAQQPYLKLAVFPEDMPFPSSAAAALWGWSEPQANKLLSYLAGQALLTPRSVDGGRWYTFHDVLHDFVNERLGEQGRLGAHAALIAGYWERCSGAWAKLQRDGYIHDHLSWHMAEAGLREELYALLDKPWRDAQFERTFSHHTFAGDVDRAIAAAGEEPVHWVQLVRGCVIYAILVSMASKVPLGALGVLAEVGDTEQVTGACHYVSLMQDPKTQCKAYEVMGKALLLRGQTVRAKEVFGQALAAAKEIQWEDATAEALSAVAQVLAQAGGRELLDQVLAAAEGIQDTYHKARTLTRVAQALDQARDRETAVSTAQKALAAARDIGAHEARARALIGVAQALAQVGESEAAAQATHLAKGALTAMEESFRTGWQSKAHAVVALTEVTCALAPMEDVTAARARCAEALSTAETIDSQDDKAAALSAVAQCMATIGDTASATAVARRALAAAKAAEAPWFKYKALAQAAGALAAVKDRNGLREALDEVKALEARWRSDALGALAQGMAHLRDDEGLADTMRAAYDAVEWSDDALLRVVPVFLASCDSAAAATVVEELATYLGRSVDRQTRAGVLALLAIALTKAGDKKRAKEAAFEALSAVETISPDTSEANALCAMSIALTEAGERAKGAEVAHKAYQVAKGARSFEPEQALSRAAEALARAGEEGTAIAAADAAFHELEEGADIHGVLSRISRALACAGAFRHSLHFSRMSSAPGEALCEIASAAVRAGKEDMYSEIVGQALRAAERVQLEEEDRLSQAARALVLVGEREKAEQAVRQRLVWLDEGGTTYAYSPEYQVYRLSEAAKALVAVGDVDSARVVAQRALTAAEAIGSDGWVNYVSSGSTLVPDMSGRSRALNRVAQAYLELGEKEMAGALARRAMRDATMMAPHSQSQAWAAAESAARTLARLGDGEGIDLLLDALPTLPEVGSWLDAMAGVIESLGLLRDANRLARVRSMIDEIGDPPGRVRLLSMAANGLSQAGEDAGAHEALRAALLTARGTGRAAVWEVMGRGAAVLARLDGGQILGQVYDRLMEVESWWGG